MHPFVIPALPLSPENLKEFGKAEFGFLMGQFKQCFNKRLIGFGNGLIAINLTRQLHRLTSLSFTEGMGSPQYHTVVA